MARKGRQLRSMVCVACREQFAAVRSDALYCSEACRKAYARNIHRAKFQLETKKRNPAQQK